MSKFVLFLTCWLITFRSNSQAPPTAFPDTPIFTKTSVGKARIGTTIAQLKKLYVGCTFTPTFSTPYGFDAHTGKPDALLVRAAGKKLFICFGGARITGFIVLHPSYKSATGIHVGSTSGQLRTAEPGVVVSMHEFVENIQIAAVEPQAPASPMYIFSGQRPIGKIKNSLEASEIAVLTAKISWIVIKPN